MIEVELPDGRILEIETLDVAAGARAATAFMNRERGSPSPAAQPMGNQDMLARTLRGNPAPGLPGPVVAQSAEGRGFAPLPRTMNEVGQRMGAALRGQVEPTPGERYGMDVPLGWVAGSGGSARHGIQAYHGSPHTFDRFDISKIGTGEGNQAYGHGLNFSDSEGLARWYRDALSVDPRDHIKQVIQNFTPYAGKPAFVPSVDELMANIRSIPMNKSIAEDIQKIIAAGRAADGTISEDVMRAYRRLDAALPQKPAGSMYEVRLNTTPDRLLDWDAPLSRQSTQVREALGRMAPEFENVFKGRDLTGGGLVRYLDNRAASELQGAAVVSSAFREAGIPGIQYFDGGSRTRNYVMFDDSLIDILRRYGWAGILAGFGAAGTAEAKPSQGERSDD